MELRCVTLEDKYVQTSGHVFITGIQALVRLPLLQIQKDTENGLNTAAYISGYRGSPLGAYDTTLLKEKKILADHKVVFHPGLNEEAAVNAVWGSQHTDIDETATVDGVVGIWYAKGVGVARAMDALKHANFAGTSRLGGVLALVGDDHNCQSSAIPHQSEYDLTSAMLPILAPATVQEILDYGQIGIALSRYSGCWVSLKVTVETIEIAGTVDVGQDRIRIHIPEDYNLPPEGLGIRWPDPPMSAEQRLHGPKMEAVQAFARANTVDRMIFNSPNAKIGIVTAGKAYQDLRQSLSDLGIGPDEAEALGLRVYKLGMIWPIERQQALNFLDGLDEVIVIEEKRGFIEEQIAHLLMTRGGIVPRLYGKRAVDNTILFPSIGQIDSDMIGRALYDRIVARGLPAHITIKAPHSRNIVPATVTMDLPSRAPFFCSGCPHNRSTKVPEGSMAMGGTGCHAIALWLPYRKTETLPQMGGEGLSWLGRSPFTKMNHVFQNLGDGTYNHSGILAIRAAAAGGVNITYKILYNDAVAMTGGQPHDKQLSVPMISRQVYAEGAKRIAVVTDEPEKYPADVDFAPGTTLHHRSDMDAVQRSLRETSGLTILIYDQTCAAEKRRRRKRGTYPNPDRRVFINDAVCEGCGDCSEQSHCISIQPLETELGRKRIVDQSNCNKDFSCVEGFCPSFVSVKGGRLRVKKPVEAISVNRTILPLPTQSALEQPFSILITGIGGTGVITLGQIIGMAAHLEGKGCSVLDFTGLAQKNGAVTSHVRIAAHQDDLHAVRIPSGSTDLLLACDAVVAASQVVLRTLAKGISSAVVNADITPVAGFVKNGDMDFQEQSIRDAITGAVGTDASDFVEATHLATALVGDSVATNIFMLGYAFQKGHVPLTLQALEEAIRINGTAVQKSLDAFNWGRLSACDREKVQGIGGSKKTPKQNDDLETIITRHSAYLRQYQNDAYARRYLDMVNKVSEREKECTKGHQDFTGAVVHSLFKLMAYKDEYEVARLYVNGRFQEKLREQFEGDFKLSFHLAPPLLAKRDSVTGHLRKREFGAWIFYAFRLLAKMRALRGGIFDLFGYTDERRMERRLIAEYCELIDRLLPNLSEHTQRQFAEIARLPMDIKGFGHVKEARVKTYQENLQKLMAAVPGNDAG